MNEQITEVEDSPTTLSALSARTSAINEDMTQDEICLILQTFDYFKEQVNAAEKLMKSSVEQWMTANEIKEFYIGTILYYLGNEKVTKCRDVAKTLEAVLLSNGIDTADINCNDIALMLSTNAWKQGACKKLLPADKFDELFETKEVTKLHVEGAKKAKELIKKDTKWME